MDGLGRRARLARSRLTFVTEAVPEYLLEAALTGGVDVVQLRDKRATDPQLAAAGRRIRARCAAHGALFIVNDRPELAARIDADGVHVGQDDTTVAAARALVGESRLVGLSTHSPAQIARANAQDVDYIGVGPVHATPTKPGRPAVGTELVRVAATQARMPFFAIGGLDAATVGAVREAGATRVAVVRAIAQAADPARAARMLRAAIAGEVTVAGA